VSRVETVTGGASASYGTDAVAGVVNFILDTEFSGFKVHSQTGATGYGDGDNYELGAAFGSDIGDRMHILVSGEVYSSDPIDTFEALRDRGFYTQSARVTNPNPAGPAEIIRPFVSPTNFTNGGIIIQPGSALDRVEFLPDGTTRVLPFSGVGQLSGGCNCYAAWMGVSTATRRSVNTSIATRPPLRSSVSTISSSTLPINASAARISRRTT